ncbi:hypothetical protein HDU97_009501 [Phlyctochytrium planicorne]|nr:hypothetical protein HDU97_009501 [Phlyctochytrium planicorne]
MSHTGNYVRHPLPVGPVTSQYQGSTGYAREIPQRPVSSEGYGRNSSGYQTRSIPATQSYNNMRQPTVDRKAARRAEHQSYITLFCQHMATVQRASRPRTEQLLKSYYSNYRLSHPISGLAPASMLFHLKHRRRVLRVIDSANKVIDWTDSLWSKYGPSGGNQQSRPQQSQPQANGHPTEPPTNAPGPALSKTEHDLRNLSREKLEANKEKIKVSDLQEAIHSEVMKILVKKGVSDEKANTYLEDDGTVVIEQREEPLRVVVHVRSAPGSPLRLLNYPYLLVNAPGLSIEYQKHGQAGNSSARSSASSQAKIPIETNSMKFFTFSITPKMHGMVKDCVVFDFEDFVVCRYISFRVVDPELQRYIGNDPAPATLFDKEKAKQSRPKAVNLPIVPAPKIYKLLSSNAEDELELSPETYSEVFLTLQRLEELQMEVDIRKYDLEKVKLDLSNDKKNFTFNVPGMAERRPSILYGDKVYVRRSGYGDREYEGYVNYIIKETIQVSFDGEFWNRVWLQNMDFDVRFTFSRTPLKRCYQGLELVSRIPKSFTFPETVPIRQIKPVALDTSSRGFRDLNKEQQNAIQSIVEQRSGTNPYVLFGPPGTGKTKCLVECIRQILHCRSNSRILALAPSNLAADQLVERLYADGGVKEGEMIRIHSYQRPIDDVGRTVLKFSIVSNKVLTHFDLVNVNEIMKKRVVVTTCITGGLLYSAGIPRGHFNFFCIDEAGQATEPEFWISIAGLIDLKPSFGSIVLTGDPKQLGPTLRSVIAKKHGLEKSFLERLMSLPLYEMEKGKENSNGVPKSKNPELITKLVRNYRSHPAILQISSSLFYNNEQVAAADIQMRESFEDWEELPRKGFPIIFHGINGRDVQEGSSPSWSNPDECGLVKKYVEKIFKAKSKGVNYSQIGIITPYRKQVQRIETLLRGYGCKVASVEEFQGQERRIIIISTVRSSAAHVQHDMMHNLGFLQNPKRFNVAVSRAKALLVVIGNPSILEADHYWGSFVKYCRDNGALIGYDPKVSGSNHNLNAFSRLRMAEERTEEEEIFAAIEGQNDGTGIGQITQQEDPAWDFRG